MAKSKYGNYSKDQLIAKLQQLEKKRYGLVWEDKQEEIAEQCERELPVLVEDKSKEIISDKKKPNHFIFEGDNYHTLYTLNFTHKKKIDVIYIDPPYNTGKDKEWRYNDKFVDKNDRYSHSKWLSFMNKRLRLAKNLLTDSGLIFISIDNNEMSQLKMLCDKIFLEKNLLDVLIWDLGTGTQAGHFVRSHEYVLAYAKNKTQLPNFSGGKGLIDDRAIKKIGIKNPASEFIFPKGTKWEANDAAQLNGIYGGAEKTELVKGKMICNNNSLTEEITLKAGWTQKSQMESFFKGEETFDSKGQKIIEFYFRANGKIYCRKDKSIINPPTIIKNIASTKTGTSELKAMIGENKFDFPKPTLFIKYLIGLQPKNSIILDFFAGSGTTGQAVLDLNKEDGGNRQFILCTNNENEICEEVTYPRIKKVIEGYSGNEGISANVKYFKTDFVPFVLTDNDKRTLVSKSTELLCIAENTFEVVKQNKKKLDYAIFKNDKKHTAIIYDEDCIEKCCLELNKTKSQNKTIIYVFSYDHTYEEEDFENLSVDFIVKPIPEAIINVYRKISKLRNK